MSIMIKIVIPFCLLLCVAKISTCFVEKHFECAMNTWRCLLQQTTSYVSMQPLQSSCGSTVWVVHSNCLHSIALSLVARFT